MSLLSLGYLVITYIFIINVIVFVIYGLDKHRAVFGERRVPEAVLIALSFLGGAFGALMGMLFFRHKTRKNAFKICVPIALVILVIFLYWAGYLADFLPEITLS